ncbi:MAG: hypothetical protein AAF495_17745 [Pseudomonadota bacterium]
MLLLRILICIVFAGLYIGAALFSSADVLFSLSVPASQVAAAVAGGSAVLLIVVAVVLQRTKLAYKTAGLLGAGLVLLLLQLPLQNAAQGYVKAAYDRDWQRVEAGLKVSELNDEPLLAPGGGPIGIRLNLTLESAEDADMGLTLFAEGPGPHPMSFLAVRKTREPPFEAGSDLYRAGQAYRLTYDLAPSIIGWDAARQGYCLEYRLDEAFEQMKNDLGATPLTLKMGQVQFEGTPQVWDFETQTKNPYDLTVFADSALAADFPLCDPQNAG